MTAELFTYDGSFLKWSDDSVSCLLFNNPTTPFGGIQAMPGGGLRFIYPGLGPMIIKPGSDIRAEIGILIGTPTKPHGLVGIGLASGDINLANGAIEVESPHLSPMALVTPDNSARSIRDTKRRRGDTGGKRGQGGRIIRDMQGGTRKSGRKRGNH
jgi:hypothetical protein